MMRMGTHNIGIHAGYTMNQLLVDKLFQRAINLHRRINAPKVTGFEQSQNIIGRLRLAACFKRLQHIGVVSAELVQSVSLVEARIVGERLNVII